MISIVKSNIMMAALEGMTIGMSPNNGIIRKGAAINRAMPRERDSKYRGKPSVTIENKTIGSKAIERETIETTIKETLNQSRNRTENRRVIEEMNEKAGTLLRHQTTRTTGIDKNQGKEIKRTRQ